MFADSFYLEDLMVKLEINKSQPSVMFNDNKRYDNITVLREVGVEHITCGIQCRFPIDLFQNLIGGQPENYYWESIDAYQRVTAFVVLNGTFNRSLYKRVVDDNS